MLSAVGAEYYSDRKPLGFNMAGATIVFISREVRKAAKISYYDLRHNATLSRSAKLVPQATKSAKSWRDHCFSSTNGHEWTLIHPDICRIFPASHECGVAHKIR